MAVIPLTVGIGGDYAGWVEVYTYLAGLGALTNDYECEQISDVTINNNWPALTITLNGHYVMFYCAWGNSHQGGPTRGFITYLNGVSGYFQPNEAGSLTGSLIIENIYFRQTTNSAVSLVRPRSASPLPRPNTNFIMRNLLIEGAAAGVTVVSGLVLDNSYINYHVENVKIWGCRDGFWTTYSGTNLYARTRTIENVTVWGCLQYAYSIGGLPEVIYMINCYGCGSASRDWNGGHGAGVTVLNNCADSDNSIAAFLAATKTDCLANVDENTELISLNDANVDFLRIDTGSDLYAVGTLGIINTESKEHYPRPNSFNVVSIGASEPNANIDFIGNPLIVSIAEIVNFTSIINECHIATFAWILDEGNTGNTQNTATDYMIPGFKTITLNVIDTAGRTAIVTKVDYIEVRNYGLDFVGVPTSGPAKLKVKFKTIFEPL
jgi:PKD repeat protein